MAFTLKQKIIGGVAGAGVLALAAFTGAKHFTKPVDPQEAAYQEDLRRLDEAHKMNEDLRAKLGEISKMLGGISQRINKIAPQPAPNP